MESVVRKKIGMPQAQVFDAVFGDAGPSMVVTHYAWNAEVPSKDWRWNKHVFKK